MSLSTVVARGIQGRRVRRAALVGAALTAFAIPATASASITYTMSGRAYDLVAKLRGITVVAGPDTGQISTTQSSTTSLNAGSLTTPYGGGSLLNAKVVTFAPRESSTSTASLATAALTLPGLPVITGKLITAESTSSNRFGHAIFGSSVAGSLTVNGTTYQIAAPPNTVIPLGPLGSITLNEQKLTHCGLTVNAVHVSDLLGLTDVVIAHASSSVTPCAP
jgi:hypothetical protein